MNPSLPDEAIAFGAAAGRAFADLGGVDAARRAEEAPERRRAEIEPALNALGVDDLDPRADADTLAAAAALCEAAGRVALPYPLPAVLLRHAASGDGAPFAVVPDNRLRVDHGDLFEQWRVATVAGQPAIASPKDGALGSRLGPFVADLVATGHPVEAISEDATVEDIALFLALSAWQVLGTVDRAVELAVEHVSGRIQFGKPLSAFQAVQFQLADAAVAVAGLRELAQFTIWRLSLEQGEALVDSLALRLHAIDVARAVLRTTQQLHGAAGVCDEYDISVLARHVQPALRLPLSAERTAALLAEGIQEHGFDGLFPHGAVHGSVAR